MLPLILIVAVLIVVFLAALLRATVGFGDALLAMPLLTLLLGIQAAAPLVALIGMAIALLILWGSWHDLDLRAVGQLVVASLLGMPIGVWLLTDVPAAWVTGGLGLLLIAFALYSLTKPTLPQLGNSRWVYLFGGIAGIFGAAYNTSGPPLVVYGALRRWSPPRFRATLQGFYLPASLLVALSHGLGGLWNRQVFSLFALALPWVALAVWAGNRLNRRIPRATFARLLYWILIGLGVLLVARAF